MGDEAKYAAAEGEYAAEGAYDEAAYAVEGGGGYDEQYASYEGGDGYYEGGEGGAVTEAVEADPYVAPTSYPLGALAPINYAGYWDDARGEMYAYDEATGECAYGVGADGDVYAVDYRNVMWVKPYERASDALAVVGDPLPRKSRERTRLVSLKLREAAVIVQSAVRSQAGRLRCIERTLKFYKKLLDPESGQFYYEHLDTGQTQWHRPAVLLGTRRRRGLSPWPVDCRDETVCEELGPYDDAGQEWYGNDELAQYYAAQTGEADHRSILTGPYCKRTGKGKHAAFAINKLPKRSETLRGKSSVDRSLPLFLDNTEVDPHDWRLGDTVQCFDGIVLKKVMVEPYMLARGAVAQGPTEVVRLMQRNAKRPQVLYFCLAAVAKFELRETEMGLCSKEATACILQTLKTLTKYPKIPALVAASLVALVSLADNYANRSVILKEEWCRLVVAAVNNLTTESQEVIVHHADGNEKITVRTATRQSCDIAASGCRLFATFASDPKLREEFAEEAIKACIVAMKFCDEDATVQSAACDCLYNYVYRCEFAAVIAEDHEALDNVKAACLNFQGDADFCAQADRAYKALSPGGWRGT